MNESGKIEKNLDILYICNSLDMGGAEKILYEIIRNCKFYNKEIICLKSKGYYSKLLENEGVKINYCNLNKNLFDFLKILKLYKLILKKRPTIIHSFLYHSLTISSILGKLSFTNKILWSVHSDYVKSNNTFLRNFQVKFLALISNLIPSKIIYCSQESLKNHEKIGFCKSKNIFINNGVCTNKFYPRKKSYFKIRKLLRLENDSFLIGHIARFHPIKGHKILLNSLKLLKRENKNFKCLMIGTNVNKKNQLLNNEIKKNKLEENIMLYGETKYPQELINAFDINIISSLSESCSLVLLEAMASGVPTLSTNVGEIKKIIGKTGLVVNNKSSRDLADKLIFLIKNRSYLKEKSFLARERIKKKYSLEQMLKKYNLIYKFFLKKSRVFKY